MEKQDRKKQLIWQLPFLLLLVVGTVLIVKQHHDMPYHQDEGMVFGTVYHITYQSDKPLKEEIEAELKKVDMALSPFNKESTITHVNNNDDVKAGDDKMFREVFELAQTISKATDGAFDITVAPLVNAWGFGFKNGIEPDAKQVDSLKALIGYEKVSLGSDGKVRKADPRMMLDCSAIAKGYGVDAVGKYLESQGISNYMVEIGGEVRVRGFNPRGELWHVGINKPNDDPASISNDIEQVIQITQLAMATSGNYRNYYEKDGKKYAHTIDPHTGYPVQHSILSSTVIAQDCATADAYATAFMVLGMDEAKKVLAKHPELMAFFIYSDNKGEMKEWMTEGMEKLIVK